MKNINIKPGVLVELPSSIDATTVLKIF